MWLETVHQSKDHGAKCPTCGGDVRERVFGEMHAGSFVQDGQRVEMRRTPSEGYRDPIRLDDLTWYFDGGLYRIWPSERYPSRGGKRLHRDVWRSAFGDIPNNCHIHHRDSDTFNNSIANLECLDSRQHLSDTWQPRPVYFSNDARERASQWHRSPAGRLWHKRHAKQSKIWTKWKRVDKPCEFCKKPFNALVRATIPQRFCSNNCKASNYRQRKAAGLPYRRVGSDGA